MARPAKASGPLSSAAHRLFGRGTTGLCFLAAVLARCSLAWADSPSPSEMAERARAIYAAGTRAFAETRFADAAQKFEEAASVVPSAVAFFTGGLAWERAGDPARAADDYARALELGSYQPGGIDEKQSEKAKERLGALEATLGTVRVLGPSGTWVRIEDQGTGARAPATLHAAAGGHVVVARSLAGEPPAPSIRERSFVILSTGKTVTLDLTAKKLDETAGAARPRSPPRQKSLWSDRRSMLSKAMGWPPLAV